MKDKITEQVLLFFVSKALGFLTPKQIEAIADRALDWCEVTIQNTDSSLDDAVLLPLIALIREAFQIEDND